MEKSDFLKSVKAELDTLKENSTPAEKKKIILKDFSASSYKNCLLGQMTGSSESERANELVPKKFQITAEKIKEVREKVGKPIIKESLFGIQALLPEAFEAIEPVDERETNIRNQSAAFELFFHFETANSLDALRYVKGKLETYEPTF